MARLDDLLPELKEEDLSQTQVKNNDSSALTGKKRRAWLLDSIEETKINTGKGVIDTIDEPYISKKIENKYTGTSKEAVKLIYEKKSLNFIDLRSNPLQLFLFLYELMQKENDNFKTPRVKLRDMMLHINISKDSARTALRFLLKQGFIERIEFQPGHLGWSRYRLNNRICMELEKEVAKGTISPFELNEKKLKEKEEANFLQNDFEDPWEKIDISPLESIGFSRKHLLQIKNKTTPEIAQESINHFSFALKNNKKVMEYPNPIATLISVLKRGEAWVEANYQSSQEIALLQILESKKAELERKKIIEEQLYNIAFDEWHQSLTKEEIENIAPDNRKKGDLVPPTSKLSRYFKENIWSEKRKEYLL